MKEIWPSTLFFLLKSIPTEAGEYLMQPKYYFARRRSACSAQWSQLKYLISFENPAISVSEQKSVKNFFKNKAKSKVEATN